MEDERQEGSVAYELALRVIGRHLDAEPAYHVSILEVHDGFVVRYQSTQQWSEARTVQFAKSRLEDLFVFHSAARGCPPKPDRHAGLRSKFPTGHQEFMRALGSELDLDGASSLTLDELPEEVRVSYLRADPSNPLRAEKCNMVFDKKDIKSLVETARKRRLLALTRVLG